MQLYRSQRAIEYQRGQSFRADGCRNREGFGPERADGGQQMYSDVEAELTEERDTGTRHGGSMDRWGVNVMGYSNVTTDE